MSVSSVSLSSDANVRYQRLAQEYTKLRAQAKVLREGVLEERGRGDKLAEELKSKEAVIRRLQAENESLTFRNDQLARRVENFQFEPPISSTSSQRKKAPPPQDSGGRIELLEHELRQKLAENERLVSKLDESERQHEIEMAEMSEKLAKEMRILQDDVKRMRMKTTKASRQEEIQEIQEQKEIQRNHEKEEEEKEMVIGSPEPPESHEEARIMVAEATRGSFSALTNVFTLLQQRCEIYPFDSKLERLPTHVEKLSSEYAQTARLFSNLVEILDSIISNSVFEPAEQLPEITSKCRLISQHCNQMLRDLVRQMTEEENRVTWCSAPLSKLNNQWMALILELFDVFERVTVSLGSSESELLLSSLDSLDQITSALLDCFQKRWIFEARLPTTTRRMRCVGAALEEALQMASQETSKLAARGRRVTMMEKERGVKEQKEREEAERAPEILEPQNPFDDEDEDDFKDASETPEPPTGAPEPPEPPKIQKTSVAPSEAPPPSDHLHTELRLLATRNEELQKERDKLFVDNSLVKRKLEIASAGTEKSTDIDQIWSIGMERRDEWIQRVQKAEKALRFYQIEFDLLLRHELASEEHLKRVLAELDSVTKHNNRLKDELESVRKGYESQLGDLSEHLATLVKEREKEKESNKSRGSLKSFFNKS
ncbi:hypothetical protein GCK72_020806 [Caenorhabditis remanei]|uniref:Protein phosphatase 1 regulatory subunit 21 n=1 Tax=Caenorhabditis remanei TaxID=31234 RepID=A0A6A5GHU1_CAERE|nr:hypothetical protein GCK72_020806 [Caenorhabditis remanei]KAF1754246.1 hypothetical protein GCK72_020806 [Caenorhabditis remanei]